MDRIINFKKKPSIVSTYTVCGPKESQGNLANYIDQKIYDDYDKQPSFELAERKMLTCAIDRAVKKSKVFKNDIGAYVGGDLLNQIISSSFTAREFVFPFLGVYNACATMVESMIVGGILVDGGYIDNVVCATCSHFSTAERQYRFPVEQGTTRPAQSQWTVTGAGANVISNKQGGIRLISAVIGRVVDYGVVDANNMGAAMAPAAADTLYDFFVCNGKKEKEYDLIITGDLGALGSRILKDLLLKKGIDISFNHVDCGELIYNIDEEEYQGGSGAGCSAIVFNSYIYKKMIKGEYKRILLVTTGALLSTTSTQQGESIPGIAHLIEIVAE